MNICIKVEQSDLNQFIDEIMTNNTEGEIKGFRAVGRINRKYNPKNKEQLKILEAKFRECREWSKEDIIELVKETKLEAKKIQKWRYNKLNYKRKSHL